MRRPLLYTAACVDGCGVLATGRSGDTPSSRRYEDRGHELELLAQKHTRDAGHSAAFTAVPEVADGSR